MTDLDRAWPRRGLVGPYPFGKTLSGVWLDDTVTFSRPPSQDPDGFGSFSAIAGEGPYLTTVAHVRLVAEQSGSTGTDSEVYTRTRSLDIRIPYPADPANMPKRGDHVTYLLHTGETLRLFIRDITDPRGFSDHLHIFASEQS